LKKSRLVGYDGVSPGPTFRMTKGRESVVRFKNYGDSDISVQWVAFQISLLPVLITVASMDLIAERPLMVGLKT
jgi:hypothetical protein